MQSRTVSLIQLGLNIALGVVVLYLFLQVGKEPAPPRILLAPRPVTNTVT
jgi:hypothetical protein